MNVNRIYKFVCVFNSTISMSSYPKSHRAHAELIVNFGFVFMRTDSRNPFLVALDSLSEIDELSFRNLKFWMCNLGLFPRFLNVVLSGCWARLILYYFIDSSIFRLFILFVLKGLLLFFVDHWIFNIMLVSWCLHSLPFGLFNKLANFLIFGTALFFRSICFGKASVLFLDRVTVVFVFILLLVIDLVNEAYFWSLEELTTLSKIIRPVLDQVVFIAWNPLHFRNMLVDKIISFLVLFVDCDSMDLKIRLSLHVVLTDVVLNAIFWLCQIICILHTRLQHVLNWNIMSHTFSR